MIIREDHLGLDATLNSHSASIDIVSIGTELSSGKAETGSHHFPSPNTSRKLSMVARRSKGFYRIGNEVRGPLFPL